MRIIIPAISLLLVGCSVQKYELRQPNTAARIDSDKTAASFAQCVSAAMGIPIRDSGNILHIVRKDRQGVEASRWDFIPTNSGSQAELRSGASDGDGMEQVRACA